MQVLTARSGLSARTYSCGGEGSLFGRGGEASTLAWGALRGALEKNLRIPSFLANCRFVSSSDGTSLRTEESSEESSADILVVVVVVVPGWGGWWKEGDEVRAPPIKARREVWPIGSKDQPGRRLCHASHEEAREVLI